jgi:cytidylate kinase
MLGPQQIAIDGPAGSGKSTVGERLARCLGYLYVDTGAMYRALAWLALHEHIAINDAENLANLARHAEIAISHPQIADGRQYTVTVHGRDITWDIRNSAVTNVVSRVSLVPAVRSILIAQQRAMAQQGRVVMVGRDIGAVVLPDAELKIYLTATLEERARRRYAELLDRLGEHNPALPSYEAIVQDIQRRDDVDRVNMQPAEDAVIVDTDHLDVQQVVDVICEYMEKTA